MQEYRNLVHDADTEEQTLKEWTTKIAVCLDRLVEAAENEIDNLTGQKENEKENTDS